MRYPTTRSNLRAGEIKPNESFYHPELDILRFFAFFAVFIHHGLPRDASAFYMVSVPGPNLLRFVCFPSVCTDIDV